MPFLGFGENFAFWGGHFSPGPRQNKDSPPRDLGIIRISLKNIYRCGNDDPANTVHQLASLLQVQFAKLDGLYLMENVTSIFLRGKLGTMHRINV